MAVWPYNTQQWLALREAKLNANPLCEACIRREVVEVAVAVDHIVSIASGGPAFPPLEGLRSLCIACHNSKTNAKDHPLASGFRRALKGYDLDGNPIDPEGWEDLPAQRSGQPGAFQGRRIGRDGPAVGNDKDLVSCEPFATSDGEDSLWV